jgi:hypothetical protein
MNELDDDVEATRVAIERLIAGGRSFLRRLDPNSSLQAVEATLGSDGEAVLALDFDQTVKVKDRTTNSAHVRGDDASIEFLRRVHSMRPRVAMCIITAADVSAGGARSIANELDQLGIADLFDVDALKIEPESILSASTQIANSRAKLCALLVLLPPTRFGLDLLRIARNSVVVRDTSVEFRLVKDKQRGALLRVTHPTVVECWRVYHQQIYGDSNDQSANDDDAVMYFDGIDVAAFENELTAALRVIGVPERFFARLMRDTAAVHDIDGVKVARFGRVLCSKYNKPEALQLFLQQDQLAPRTIVFVDDNLTNAFNMFATHAAAQATSATSQLHSFWFEPPAGGKEETVRDERAMALARALIAHFGPPDQPTSAATSPS